MTEQVQSIKDIIREEYKKCALSPAHFMRKYCQIQHPDRGKIPFHLYYYQEDLINTFLEHDRTLILKSRQLGISTLVAGYVLWLTLFHDDKNVLIIAINQDVSKNMITKIKVMNELLPSWLKRKTVEDNRLSMRFNNGSQIKAIATTGTSGRSEALSLLVVDEAAFIDNFEPTWASLQQTMATGGRAIILSTPNGVGGWFHQTWVKASANENDFFTVRLPWHVHPDRDAAWRERQNTELGERLASQECDASFLSSGHSLIPHDLLEWYRQTYAKEPIERRGIDGNLWIWELPDYSKDYIVSVDVARGDGNDYSAIQVIDVESLTQIAEYRGQISTRDLGNMAVNIATEYNDALLVIENTGVGWAAIQAAVDRSYKNLYYTIKDNVYDTDLWLAKKYDMVKENSVAGFTTSTRSRPLVVGKIEEAFNDKSITIYSKRLIDELETFVWKTNRVEAMSGYNDDLCMSLAIGLWVRDTAFRLRQHGMQLAKASIEGFKSVKSDGVYTPSFNYTNPYEIKLGGNVEKLDWLL